MKNKESTEDEIVDFFKDQSGVKYSSLKKQIELHEREIAGLLKQKAIGDVLSIGGVWEFFEWNSQLKSLTILDLSKEMLEDYAPENSIPIIGNLFTHEFNSQQFDAVVFPFILHHTAEGSWTNCENRIVDAFERAHRWLKPNGKILIIEACPHPLWYPVQRGLFSFIKLFLAIVKQPPVVNFTKSFYLQKLNQKFRNSVALKIIPEGYNQWAWYPVFMATHWLRLPMIIYPKIHLLSGEKT